MSVAAPPAAPRSPRPRLSERLQVTRVGPLTVVSWLVLLGVLFLAVYPLLGTIWDTFKPGAPPLGLKGNTYQLVPTLKDTAWVVAGSASIAIIVGVGLAWIHERTDAHLGWVGEVLPLTVLIIPQIAGVIGWIILFDPRIGYANSAIRSILGVIGIHISTGPISIYSKPMVVVVCAVYLVPYVFLVMTAALQGLDSSLEEASRVSGARTLRTLTHVVLPALAPSIGAALIIVVIRALTTFVIIAVIGTTAGVQTLPVYIYHLITTFPPQTGQAVILAGGLMLAVQLLLFVQARVVKPHRYATIGGKGGAVRRTRLGIGRPFARAATLIFLLFAAVLPMLAVIVVSLVPFWSSSINWGHMSLHAFQQLFAGGSTTAQAIRNSVIIAGVGASLVVLFAVLAIAPQRSGRGRRVAGVITTLPSMIPHTLVGVAFIVALSGSPFDLYGTIALLLLAYLLMEIPYAAQATQAAASAVGVELGEASRVSGAGEGRTLLRVQVPLMGAGLAGAWIVAFIHMMTEATASSMLAGISNPVVGPQLLGLVTDGTYTQVAALSTIVAIVCSVLVGIMLVIRRRATRRMRVA